ncbi:MAG: triple tyrosine motif-containing protein [Verrucomicrobia bacterium]|nr:triple tyrosine motif-containing protein [Verrucomicrobiota bacterium]
MKMPALRGVVLLMTVIASVGTRAEQPASASTGTPDPSPASAPPTDSGWVSRTWQTDDGLPGNVVVGVAQTPDGFLWVATENGLARFDGVRFQEAASGAIAPSGSKTQTLLADSGGRLWLGKQTSTIGGAAVCVEAGRTRVFTQDDGQVDCAVDGMVEDGEGAVWITSNGLVRRIHQGCLHPLVGEEGVPGSGRVRLARDGRGRLWFAQGCQVGVYREGMFRPLLTLSEPLTVLSGAKSGGVWIGVGTRVLKYTGEGEPQDLGELAAKRPEVKPTVLFEDRRGRLWAGTEKAGLFLYNGSGFDEAARSSREILCLADDREGNLWLGTQGGGLVRVRPRAFELEALGSGPSSEGMRSVCQDASGTLWAVTLSGRLARKEGPLWRVLSTVDGWSGVEATCVTAAPEGGVMVGTRHDGLHGWHAGLERSITPTNGLASGNVNALLTTPSGDVWIGTVDPNAVQRLRADQFQTFTLPQILGPYSSLAVDAAGRVWAATQGGVLARVDQEALVDETPMTLGVIHPIGSLCATPDGSLWIGYYGLGVGRLKQGRFTRFDHQQGLPDDFVNYVLEDGHGRLWFAANRGLFSVAEKEFESVAEGRQGRMHPAVYGREEGMPTLLGSTFYWPAMLRGTDGRLWMPAASGLAMVDPDPLTENRQPPPVVIERVVVDGRTVAAYEPDKGSEGTNSTAPLELHQSEARLRLPPGADQIELEYTGLSFVASRNLAFKYRLEGLDQKWVEAGSRRVAYYSHLPPGDYRFKVMACSNDGVWNEEGASLAITVLPHVWQTTWFRLLGIATGMAGLIGTGWGIARRRARRRIARLKRLHALDRERSRIARDIHDDLGSNLTRIAWLSELARADKDLPDKVDGHSRKIGDYARQMVTSLDEIVWAVNPRNDTLQSLAQYLTHMAHEYLGPTSVSCRLEIPSDLPAAVLPAEIRHDLFLASKEALHNILKHAAASEARIRLALADGVLTLVVEDDGRGFDLAAPSSGRPGHGLRNLRQRIENLGGRFQCESAAGCGTRLTFTLKLPDGA